jgi:hypothetical protein
MRCSRESRRPQSEEAQTVDEGGEAMFRVEPKKTRTTVTIRILKSRAKEFAKFRKELDALLKKHKVKRKR